MKDQSSADWRLDIRRYAFRQEFRTRYADLDWRGQTHEVAIGRLMEATRYYPMRELLGSDARDAYDSVLGRVSIRHLRPGAFEGIVVGGASIVHVGTRSFSWCTGLFHEGSCFALSEATQIAIDAQGRSRPLSDAARTRLTAWMAAANVSDSAG